MKFKRIISAIIACTIAVSAAGCSDSGTKAPENVSSNENISSDTQNTDNSDENGDSEQQPDEQTEFTSDRGTQISLIDNTMKINRRQRENPQKMGEKGWTILLYLCGTDLESEGAAGTNDISEMVSANFNEDVRVVIQTGGTSQWQNEFVSSEKLQRYVTAENDISLVEELDIAPMGDEATLESFISWGVENYPAENMGLIFWNHGGGSISGVCFDETNDNKSLSLKDIDVALSNTYDKMTDKFEFIGFDACLMGTLETANILVPYARYMFASEETEPGGGWDYVSLLNFLAENPSANGAQLGSIQCESYYQHCIDNGDSEGTTFAITDLSKLDDLILTFNDVAKELYESDSTNAISKAIFRADNFGGNNRSEGYTNMVDLLGLLNNVKGYSESTEKAINALQNAVICSCTGPKHEGVGGLSLYFPLSVQGSTELSTFREVCTSTYYLALVDKIAYGTTGSDVSGYDNIGLVANTNDIWSGEYNPDSNVGANTDSFTNTDTDKCPFRISEIGTNEDGIYYAIVENADVIRNVACSLYLTDESGSYIYIGESEDIIADYENGIFRDNFNGSWLYIGDNLLTLEFISSNGTNSFYSSPIKLNGKKTNLQLMCKVETGEFTILGTCSGISESGMAARDDRKLVDGDVIVPIYTSISDNGTEEFTSGSYTVNGTPELNYGALHASQYEYSFSIYDVYGNVWYTSPTIFTVNEDGNISFTESVENPEE